MSYMDKLSSYDKESDGKNTEKNKRKAASSRAQTSSSSSTKKVNQKTVNYNPYSREGTNLYRPSLFKI